MKRQAETRTPNDELPSFLDESSATTDLATGTEVDAGEADTTADPALSADFVEGGQDATLEGTATEPGGSEQELAGSGTEPSSRAATRRANSAARRATVGPAKVPTGGGFSIALGCTALLGAFSLGFLPANEAFTPQLERFGVNPATLAVFGAVLVGSGLTRRRLGKLYGRIESASNQRGEGADTLQESLQESLQFLVAAQQASSDKPPAAGEELQHLMIAMQRQDEKINNLTKAIKMYGKPLMEISGQGTELAASLAQVRTSVDTSHEAARQTFTRLETQLRMTGTWKQDLASLQESVQQLTKAVGSIDTRSGAMPSLDPLTQQLQRVEVHVQAIGHRLEDTEVRKSLLRLEDTVKHAGQDLKQLLRGEAVEKVAGDLQKRLESATTRLNDGLSQMREGNLGGIETAIRDIQREVAGVATAVTQIQVAVKNGAMRAAAPAPTTPATPVAAAAPAPAAAPTSAPSAPAPAPAAPAPASDASGSYQTGTRTSNSKNVLGAIAKLKQMKN